MRFKKKKPKQSILNKPLTKKEEERLDEDESYPLSQQDILDALHDS